MFVRRSLIVIAVTAALAAAACGPPPAPADTVAPVLSLPADISVPATSASGATVTFVVTANDAVDGAVPVTCTPSSGSLFAVGDSSVSCSATDAAGNTASGGFLVTVAPYLPGAVPVDSGNEHSCALPGDGTVSCWGLNVYGQLGNGTSGPGLNVAVPVPVTGLTNAVAITTGYNYSCALLGDGTVSCWGRNANGANADSNVPVPVTGLTNAIAITAGDVHSCALLGDGTVSCWGYNFDGQLGNGTSGPGSTVPVPVTGLTNAIAVSAGSDDSCAVLGDGTVSCWGYNLSGQLGNGTNTDSNIPVPVTGFP